MGFDDLARHMAGRDGKLQPAITDANDFVARAAEDNRRIDRRNNLILGSILLLGGLFGGVLLLILSREGAYSPAGMAASGAGILIGAQRIYRGVRG